MLSPLDDFPYHQISTTFDTAGPSDPRFFDRYWWVFNDPEGRFCLCTGLGVYKNMNVMDGQDGDFQLEIDRIKVQ